MLGPADLDVEDLNVGALLIYIGLDAVTTRELPNYVDCTREDWIRIEHEFNQYWQFPNCIGALDGKHIIITVVGQ